MKRRPRRKRKALDIILVAICASSLAAAALIGWTILHEGAVYSEISTELVVPDTMEGKDHD